MKKKILGIKVGSILTGLLCLAVAFAFWFFVKYADRGAESVKDLYTESIVYEH